MRFSNVKACIFHSCTLAFRRTRVSSDSDILISLFLSFSIFFSRFLYLTFSASRRQLSIWHLRHRFHSYNIGDNLLYHPIASETRVPFRFVPFRIHTGKGWRFSSLSAHSCIECRYLRCLAAFSLSFQFTFSVDDAARNISGMRSTTCLWKSKSEYHFSSFLLVESSTVQTDSLLLLFFCFSFFTTRTSLFLPLFPRLSFFTDEDKRERRRKEKKDSRSSWQCQCLRRCNEILSVQLKPRI